MIDSQLSYESRCQYLRAVSSSGPSSRWRSRRLICTSLWCQSLGPSLRWRASPRREIIVQIMVLVLACGVKVRVRDPPPRFGGLPLAKGGRNILILIPQYVPKTYFTLYYNSLLSHPKLLPLWSVPDRRTEKSQHPLLPKFFFFH